MDKNLIQSFYGLIPYKYFNKLFWGTWGTTSAMQIILRQYKDAYYYSPLMFLTMLLMLGNLSFLSNNRYAKGVLELEEVYKEFIKNYSKLNQVFDLTNPVQIEAMFTYLLYRGYLSCGKKFTGGEAGVVDALNVKGANILGGKGVCRHIAPMLNDILNYEGFKAFNLGCCLRINKFMIDVLESQELSHEEQISFIESSGLRLDMQEVLKSKLEYYWQQGKETKIYWKYDKVNSLERIFGNHDISYVEDDNNGYFFDPKHRTMYDLVDGKLVDYMGFVATMHFGMSSFNNESKKVLQLAGKFIHFKPLFDKEEADALNRKTILLVDDNKDILEQFYKDNEALYEEASQRLKRVLK